MQKERKSEGKRKIKRIKSIIQLSSHILTFGLFILLCYLFFQTYNNDNVIEIYIESVTVAYIEIILIVIVFTIAALGLYLHIVEWYNEDKK